MSFKVLESVLRPLSYWYNQDNIEEVAVNRSGQIWLRLRGKRAYPWVMYKDEKLSKEYLVDLLYIVANTYELPFDPVEGFAGRLCHHSRRTPFFGYCRT